MTGMQRLTRFRRAARFGLLAGLAAGLLATVAALLPVPAAVTGISVALTVALVVAASVRAQEGVLTSVAALARQVAGVRSAVERLSVQNAEVGAIASMSAMDVPYPLPLGDNWALGWHGAAVLARVVGSERPETIVELGSGASSLVIGLQLSRIGRGRLLTLDHEPEYAAITRRHVAALGLDPWVTVLDAPLVDCRIGDEQYRWYDLPDAVTSLDHIDLLVVDGPPLRTDPQGTPRYPALPMLGDRLGGGSMVFVDDARRDAERRMLEHWQHDEPAWVRETIDAGHGTAILRWAPSPSATDRTVASQPGTS